VRYLGVSTGDMEKGAMRCEPNMSLRPKGSDAFGVKVEIKNLNSLRAVRDSIAYEIKRQTELLNRGENVRQVTMGWDDARGVTFVQRDKEDAHDYRYFPEPDLPPLDVSEDWLNHVKAQVPELALSRHDRYRRDFGFSSYDATILSSDRAVSDWFEAAVNAPTPNPSPKGGGEKAKSVSNLIQGEVFRLMKANGLPNSEISAIKVTPAQLAGLIALVDAGAININTAKAVFEEMFATGEDAQVIVEAKGLAQVSDAGALQTMIDDVIAANPQQVQNYLKGQDKLFGFFVGQVMKATKGKGNAPLINQLLKDALDKLKV
jgi:aspartyl-tRNA(Asn)/glutamyl-tRNA(Gln) amidotransferase subunit B